MLRGLAQVYGVRTSLVARTAGMTRGMEEFFDHTTKDSEYPFAGRAWTASELRLKSFEDLHRLWYLLAKERNLLLTERAMARSRGRRMKNPQRVRKVRKTMARIKAVLGERMRVYQNLRQEQIEAAQNGTLETTRSKQESIVDRISTYQKNNSLLPPPS